MRILITNNTLDQRGGSELYVRDLAIELLKRGHTPIAYSTKLGDVAQDMRNATIPVIDNLDALGSTPDIIHGHHHLETMSALLRFPGVPAISLCHGWLPWEESPPRFPRILRYAAVDYVCRDRLILESGISPDKVRVFLNFIDLERFKPRGPLPDRPKRALIFSNYASEDTQIPAVREACARHALALDIVGRDSGNVCEHPEEILGDYDIVFAKGKSALEALAIGAAVVLCDASGAGPLVTTGEFDRLRPLNFGVRTLRDPVTSDVLDRQIARYDAVDAATVGQLVRASAGRDAVIDQIVSMYREVIAENESITINQAEEARAAANYLSWLSPTVKSVYDSKNRAASAEAEFARVNAELEGLRPLVLERGEALEKLSVQYLSTDAELERLRALVLERGEALEALSIQYRKIEPSAHQLAMSEEEAAKLRLTADSLANQLKEVTARLVEKECELAGTGHTSLTTNGDHDYSPSNPNPAPKVNEPTVMEEVFSDIYRRRAWGEDCESVSGPGSSNARTSSFRDAIAVLLNEIKARTLLDAGCGDFNWMKLIQLDLEQYFGVDVVPDLISVNQREYGTPTRTFINLDLSRDSLPKADLILSRDCLVHFSFQDVFAAIKNFGESDATYLLTTTFPGIDENLDIETGGWRYLNLQMPPFNFPEPLKLIEESRTVSGDVTIVKYLGLWALKDLLLPGRPNLHSRELTRGSEYANKMFSP